MAGLLHKITVNMGFRNIPDFLVRYYIPLFATTIVTYFILIIFLPDLPVAAPYIIATIGIGAISVYPFILIEQKRNDINSTMHLFITFAGAISTINVPRGVIFKKIAEKESFGEISNVMNRIIYLARSWNLGYANSCRRISLLSPSKIFADFLDRFAVVMDFGEDLQIFLMEEQDAIMDDYAVEYTKSLERIKMIQEVFLALTMAMAFMLTVGMLMPLISGDNIQPILYGMLAIITLVDVGLLFFVKSFVPKDPLEHNLSFLSQEAKQLNKIVYAGIPVASLVFLVLLWGDWFSLIVSSAIAAIPLFIIGIAGQRLEDKIYQRDRAYPIYIRSLGTVVEIRSGAVIPSLHALQVHDFGSMNDVSVNLYRRLRARSDKDKSWMLFGAESGSNLIVQFTNIFKDAITLGGSAQKIGELISKNFTRLLSLRKLKLQLSSTLRGGLYGALAGLAVAGFIAAEITQILGNILAAPSENLIGGEAAGIVGDLTPTDFLFELDIILLFVGIILLIHSFVSGLILKIIEGGNPYAAFFDIAIMIWISAILSIIIPVAMVALLPTLI
ncbi:MAG: hypothetical protein ACMXYF_03945 [Candidatus Woesearchaeota archaeon]